MVFSSPLFLFGFAPLFFLAYFVAPDRAKNGVAIAGSLLFYAWGAPRFVFVLLATTTFDYVLSLLIFRHRDSPYTKRALVAASIVSNVLLLGYFKYANFFVGELNGLFGRIGEAPLRWTDVALPIGISFIVFHKVSYVVDVSRGRVPPAATFGRFLLYILLFPQLIAGPIIRYHDIADQLATRRHGYDVALAGLFRFSLGLAKKVLIADPLGQIADGVFALAPAELAPGAAWLGILSYTFQIYFDFSGYSDMAIGLARLMGFRFPENFDCPYVSQTITEFWRRWHISLSSWMREYLYVPLGGNRVSTGKTYRNLWIVFFLSGLWHGASWTFVVWGLYHGAFLSLDKLGWLRVSERLPPPVNRLLTFLIVVVGWVFFRSDSIAHAVWFLTRMTGVSGPENLHVAVFRELVTRRACTALAVAAALSFAPAWQAVRRRVTESYEPPSDAASPHPRFAVAAVLLLLSSMALANSSFHPFIYFRF